MRYQSNESRPVRKGEAGQPMGVARASFNELLDDEYSKDTKCAALAPMQVKLINGKLVVIK